MDQVSGSTPDLKRAALKHNSIVQGLPARPRFVSYVSELIAQLTTYQRYFAKPNNASWAEHNLGVTANAPRLIGVVGNFDTFVPEHVDLALQQYKDNIVIVSYSDVANMLQASEDGTLVPRGIASDT